MCALNPYFTPKKHEFPFTEKVKNYQVNQAYNCKVKHYPDGTQNICIAQSDIFGRNENNLTYNNKAYRGLKQCCNLFWSLSEYEQQQAERKQLEKDIQLYFKSVDNYMLFLDQSRKFDKMLTHDSLVWGGNAISESEREFLNSLRSSLRTDNLKKTKDKIFDYVMCNEWEYFFTGTIDPKKYDSHNAHKIKKPLKKWFEHMSERYGLSYICIFEYHKKGGIHIHGLIRSSPLTPLKLVESDTRSYFGFKKPMRDKTALKHGLDITKGRRVYNLKTWRFGWSTAIKIYGTQQAIAHYITKYITKSNQKIMGRYFWHSRDLKKPNIFYMNTSYEDIPTPKYHGFKFLYAPSENQELYQEYTDILYDQEENDDLQGFIDII